MKLSSIKKSRINFIKHHKLYTKRNLIKINKNYSQKMNLFYLKNSKTLWMM